MKYQILKLLLFSCFFISTTYFTWAVEGSNTIEKRRSASDSIVDNVLHFSTMYEKIVESYTAQLYVKSKKTINKQNYLLRFAPSMFYGDGKNKEYITESQNELHYTAPNIYDQKMKALIGNSNHLRGLSSDILQYFHMNIYSSTLLYDKLLSPLAANARKFYNYKVDSVFGTKDNLMYRIKVTPKIESFQLLSGYLIVSDQLWTVRELFLKGRSEYMKYNIRIWMGKDGDEEFLPIRYETNLYFRLLWNSVDFNYLADLKYSDIKLTKLKDPQRTKTKYDITESFSLSCDERSFFTDSIRFDSLRPLPLSESEKKLYQNYAVYRDTTFVANMSKSKNRIFWGQAGDLLLNSYTVRLSNLGNVECSPIFNPLLMNYSQNDGLSYRQEFKYNKLFSDDRLLRVVPKMGYNFKRSEFYWSINSDYDYWPSKRAAIHLSFGNGNRIYSSKVLESVKSIPDSLFNFDDLHLDYFKDLFVNLSHSVEVTNGLFISTGITMHQRNAVKPSKIIIKNKPSKGDNTEELLDGLRSSYVSFAPRIQVEWTPGQYYYMKGKRKINVFSHYPTFSLDYERGIKGVMTSSGLYERIEFDMQHHIPLGLMCDLYYRIGAGAFTNNQELYFVDYVNFSKSNLPVGWHDDVAGVFQELDGRWFNSAEQYIRGHVTYQCPFLLLHHLKKYTRSVINERIYLSALYVPRLSPYMEIGYGVGTHIFDAGVFANFTQGKFKQVGFKFTFELFNR